MSITRLDHWNRFSFAPRPLGSLCAAALSVLLGASGCAPAPAPAPQSSATAAVTPESGLARSIAEALAKLPPEDRAVAQDQQYCAVSTHEPLGSMGVPFKLMVQGQPVFLCCEGCSAKALSEPEATLARVTKMKQESAGAEPTTAEPATETPAAPPNGSAE